MRVRCFPGAKDVRTCADSNPSVNLLPLNRIDNGRTPLKSAGQAGEADWRNDRLTILTS